MGKERSIVRIISLSIGKREFFRIALFIGISKEDLLRGHEIRDKGNPDREDHKYVTLSM